MVTVSQNLMKTRKQGTLYASAFFLSFSVILSCVRVQVAGFTFIFLIFFPWLCYSSFYHALTSSLIELLFLYEAAIQCLKKKRLIEQQIEQLGNMQLRVHDQVD